MNASASRQSTKALVNAHVRLARYDRDSKLEVIQKTMKEIRVEALEIIEGMDAENMFNLLSEIADFRTRMEQVGNK